MMPTRSAQGNLVRAGRAGLLLTVALYASPAVAIDWDNPPQGLFADEWMVIELQGQKVGYSQVQMSRDGDVIETSNLMALVLKRAGSDVPINVLQTTRESLAGEVLAFTSRMDASAQALHKQGRVESGKVIISSNQFGVDVQNEVDFPKGAVMSWGALRRQRAMGYEPGTKYVTNIYEPMFSESAAVPVEMTIVGPEEIEIGGKKVKTIRTTQQMMGMTTSAWLGPDEQVVRTELPLMGLAMVMTRATRAEALAEFTPPEFFMPTTIPARRPIDRENARSIEFVVQTKNKAVAMPALPATAMQKPGDVESNAVRLVVSRLDHAALAKTPVREFGAEAAEYLKPNAIINSDDPAVKAMAREGMGDAKTPYEIADRLRRYVTDVIADKNLDVGFATASEVCRNKQGDCSEHAVLLAALGRACGLPSRVVTGLVYVPIFGGSDDIFGFHMWTQFLIGDTWVDFDAAQHESDCNPTHIAFSVSSLSGAGLGQIALDLVNIIGNLDIEIIRVEPIREPAGTEVEKG